MSQASASSGDSLLHPLLEATIGERVDEQWDSGQEMLFDAALATPPPRGGGILGIKSLYSMVCRGLVSAKIS